MGSIAMDGGGNIALGYSASSTAVFPSIRYTGRLAGDTLGAMPQVETTIVAGSGSNSSNRWGDYSSMNVDPADDCTFWYTNEYATSNGTWNTQVASFRFTACAGGPTLPSLSINDAQVTEGDAGTTNTTFTVTLSETSTQTVTVGYATADGTAQAPSGSDVFSSAATIAVPGSGTSGNAGPYPSTITVPSRAAATKVTASVTLSHTYPADVDILLVGPAGQSVVLLSDVGSGTDAVNVALTFDDTGPAVPNPLSSGTFRPTNSGTGDDFPSPAPQGTPATSLSVFNGTNPTGTWSLYAVDDAGVDSGSISGWSLGLEPTTGTGDYTAATGTVSLTPNTTTQTFTVGVLGDVTPEADETFAVNLSGAVNATIADTQGVGTILDDDGALPTLSITDVQVSEGDTGATNAVFTVTQSAASAQTVSVGYTTADGTAQAAAGADVFSNTSAITIPASGTSGSAGPYPSTITVPARATPVTKVSVTLSLSHTYPDDIDILLVGPTGESVVLMSDVGGGTDAVDVTLTFDDTGPGLSPPLSSGTFQPTNSGSGDPFPSPAPQTTPGTTLAVFNGTNPTGTWSLYVEDDAGSDNGASRAAGAWGSSRRSSAATTSRPRAPSPSRPGPRHSPSLSASSGTRSTGPTRRSSST